MPGGAFLKEKNPLWAGSPLAKRSPRTVRRKYDGLDGHGGWGEMGTSPVQVSQHKYQRHRGENASHGYGEGEGSLSSATTSTAPVLHAVPRAELGLQRGTSSLRGSGENERTPRSNGQVNATNSQGGGCRRDLSSSESKEDRSNGKIQAASCQGRSRGERAGAAGRMNAVNGQGGGHGLSHAGGTLACTRAKRIGPTAKLEQHHARSIRKGSKREQQDARRADGWRQLARHQCHGGQCHKVDA